MLATMTILGLYSYDSSIFDGLVLPGTVDKSALVTNLVSELDGFEIGYTNPVKIKELISAWSKKMQGPWTKLYNTTILQYDVLRNYDITKEMSTVVSGENHVTGRGSDINLSQKYGFSDGTAADSGKVTTTLGSGNDTIGSSSTVVTDHEYGDASLRTTQQVLEEERKSALYNFYDQIISDFKKRFCLLVYD